MIDTNLEFLLSELKEVENLFEGADLLKIRHKFTESENKFVNTVTVNGKIYAYGNLVLGIKDDIEKKRLLKRYAKLSLYKGLSKYFEKDLPWGALTGIRPTKLAYQQIEKDGCFTEFFTDVMKVSKEKTELVESIINTQKGIYEQNDENTDFFVFIPFCPSRCKYCSFISADIKSASKYVDEYVDTLVDEINYSARFVKKLRSIYIGGGTPVALGDIHLEKVLCAIDKINTGVEYTDFFDVEMKKEKGKYVITAENISAEAMNTLLKELGMNQLGASIDKVSLSITVSDDKIEEMLLKMDMTVKNAQGADAVVTCDVKCVYAYGDGVEEINAPSDASSYTEVSFEQLWG